MSLPLWRFCNVVHHLLFRNVWEEKRLDKLKRDLDSVVAAHDRISALRARLGRAAIAGAPIGPGRTLHRGRWRKVAPPGWDDATVEADARRAAQQVSQW